MKTLRNPRRVVVLAALVTFFSGTPGAAQGSWEVTREVDRMTDQVTAHTLQAFGTALDPAPERSSEVVLISVNRLCLDPEQDDEGREHSYLMLLAPGRTMAREVEVTWRIDAAPAVGPVPAQGTGGPTVVVADDKVVREFVEGLAGGVRDRVLVRFEAGVIKADVAFGTAGLQESLEAFVHRECH